MECAACGLTPCDLPDGVDPESTFERGEDGKRYCWICLPMSPEEGSDNE